MGTHIDGYFPRVVERSAETVQARLTAVFADLADDLAVIRERGRFSSGGGGWWVAEDEGRLFGEGPGGFSISVYPAVIEFTSVERFAAIDSPVLGIQEPLRRVFAAVAARLGAGAALAVAAGGFGDTDRAGGLAAEGASFADVCRSLEAVIGPPARSWEALEAGVGLWYLSDATVTAPDGTHLVGWETDQHQSAETGAVPEEALVEAADELFRTLDAEDARNACSGAGG
ncbi:MAG: hypothetical protein L0Z62_02960 [Gemmataceae bacterium]|nr:hypothetical protein [Gemmataceae bacterium]